LLSISTIASAIVRTSREQVCMREIFSEISYYTSTCQLDSGHFQHPCFTKLEIFSLAGRKSFLIRVTAPTNPSSHLNLSWRSRYSVYKVSTRLVASQILFLSFGLCVSCPLHLLDPFLVCILLIMKHQTGLLIQLQFSKSMPEFCLNDLICLGMSIRLRAKRATSNLPLTRFGIASL
jgi:hypothetical protein